MASPSRLVAAGPIPVIPSSPTERIPRMATPTAERAKATPLPSTHFVRTAFCSSHLAKVITPDMSTPP